MLSVANVHFRDTQYFVTILLQIWLYLTPIIYPITLVAGAVGLRWAACFGTSITILDIYNLNPMVYFVELFRNLLYDNRLPGPVDLASGASSPQPCRSSSACSSSGAASADWRRAL